MDVVEGLFVEAEPGLPTIINWDYSRTLVVMNDTNE